MCFVSSTSSVIAATTPVRFSSRISKFPPRTCSASRDATEGRVFRPRQRADRRRRAIDRCGTPPLLTRRSLMPGSAGLWQEADGASGYLSFKLAEMATEIEGRARCAVTPAALKEEQVRCIKEASMSVVRLPKCERVCSAAIQIHGGYASSTTTRSRILPRRARLSDLRSPPRGAEDSDLSRTRGRALVEAELTGGLISVAVLPLSCRGCFG